MKAIFRFVWCCVALQLEAEYKKSPVGVKASVQGINSKPKVSGSACFSYKGFSVGGDATMAPSKDGVNVGAYSAGAEYSADKSTVALVADGTTLFSLLYG